MNRGDLFEITTPTGRAMTVLLTSDLEVSSAVGYVFVTPVMPEAGGRAQATVPVRAASGHAILWRMQAVPIDRLTSGTRLGAATSEEMTTVSMVLAALLGMS